MFRCASDTHATRFVHSANAASPPAGHDMKIQGVSETDAECAPGPGAAADEHVQPFVHEADGKRALHFSICEVQSRLDLRHPDRLDIEYTRLMMAFLLLQARPAHIAMIGLGGGSLARFCHRHLPGASISVAESNPHVIALRERFLVPPDSDRFKVLQTDGAGFVRIASSHVDVLLIDGYDAYGLPRSLSTQRFFDHCARALRPGGVLVMNLYTDAERRVKVLERIRRSFGGIVLPVDDSDGTNCVAFACHGPALSALHQGPMPRPRGLEAAAWASLQGAFARVLGAWKEEFS